MTGPLLANVLYFAENEMDCINDETIELLEPYLNLRDSRNSKQKLFDPEIAKNTSAALWGLSSWVIGMSDYAKESSKGKQVLLSLKEDGLDDQWKTWGRSAATLSETNQDKTGNRSMNHLTMGGSERISAMRPI